MTNCTSTRHQSIVSANVWTKKKSFYFGESRQASGCNPGVQTLRRAGSVPVWRKLPSVDQAAGNVYPTPQRAGGGKAGRGRADSEERKLGGGPLKPLHQPPQSLEMTFMPFITGVGGWTP